MKFFSSVKKYSIGVIIVTFLLGFVFTVFPAQCKQAISLVIGISLIAFGLIGIIKYIAKDRFIGSLVTSIITLVLGFIICAGVIQILNIIVGVIGALLIIFGLINIAVAIKIISGSIVFGWVSLIMSVVSVVLGAIAIANTNETTVAVFRFLGIALIFYAVLDTVSYIQFRRLVKTVNNAVDVALDDGTIETDAEIIE